MDLSHGFSITQKIIVQITDSAHSSTVQNLDTPLSCGRSNGQLFRHLLCIHVDMTNLAIVFLMFSLGAFAGAPTIKVTQALWGTKDVTTEAAAFCDDKESCDYKVAPKYIGEAQGPKKTFSISWHCDDGAPQSLSLNHDATGQLLHLKCAPTVASVPPVAPSISQPYSHTFRSILTTEPDHPLTKAEDGKCLRAIKKYSKGGQKFEAESLRNMLTTVGGNGTRAFYHYFDALAVKQIGMHNRFTEIFDYMRVPGMSSLSNSVLYIADDSHSSRAFGSQLLVLYLRSDALILEEMGSDSAASQAAYDNLKLELLKKYPGLKTCTSMSLYYLTAEDMGVGLVHYAWGYVGNGHWYQLISPDAIDYVELGGL